ncbi:MAG: GNAT family N-acetyltransferase [Bacteroidota bacterium]
MVALSLQVRKAVQADQRQISNLIYFESRVHRHLDWRAPLDWLGSPHYWVLGDGADVLGALACPQDPPGIAWIRLFACTSDLPGVQAWSALWETARQEIAAGGGATVAAIATQSWFEDLLAASGFRSGQSIIMLEWNDGTLPPVRAPAGVQVRRMRADDLLEVVKVDASAFERLWQNSLESLEQAFPQSVYASVAMGSAGMLGYQLSTGNPLGAHLARLAVRPEAQGLGIGGALVGDLILRMRERGRSRITVNTQSDNRISQALYERLGFRRTGEQFPVFTQPI